MARAKAEPRYTGTTCTCKTPSPTERRITRGISWMPCGECGNAIARDETKTTGRRP